MTKSRIVPVFLLAFAVSPLWEVAEAGSGPAQTRPPPSQFNGYVWLDIHGEPLPFQSDAEIEASLLELMDQRGADAVLFDMMVGESTGE